MPLTPTAELIAAAARAGTGIGAFNVVHLETAEALVGASEDVGLPVIVQISQNCVDYHGGLRPIAVAVLAMAAAARTDVAVHLDHAEDEQLINQAIELGFGSVMYDGAALDYEHNVHTTARVVTHAHANGVLVEAELGEIGGKNGAHTPGVRTNPDEARRFVAETGVDALAVAVGSSHAMTERIATLDLDLITKLRQAVPVPLVLHGSSGASDETIAAAIRAGMTKVNVSTHLNGRFTGAIRRCLLDRPEVVDSRGYVSAGRDAVRSEAARLLELFASVGPGVSVGADQ